MYTCSDFLLHSLATLLLSVGYKAKWKILTVKLRYTIVPSRLKFFSSLSSTPNY